MKDLLEFIVKSIVSQPDQVTVSEHLDEEINLLTVKVAKEDAGTVIGQQGKTIKAIKTLLALSNREKRFAVEIEEA